MPRRIQGSGRRWTSSNLPQGRFQLTPVDDCSRFLADTVMERYTTAAVCRALLGLLDSIPFSLRRVQTDNGSEFGRDLTRLLHHLGIRHSHIQPRCPHLNGKVERVQRTVQEEFWDGIEPGPLEDWERFLQEYVRFYNPRRQHSALGCATPMQYALQRLPRQARVSHMFLNELRTDLVRSRARKSRRGSLSGRQPQALKQMERPDCSHGD